MTAAYTTKLSAQKFLTVGDDPLGYRLELVHGDIKASPSPSFDHAYVDTQLRIILGVHIKQNGLGVLLGDVDTIFDQENVRRPDLLFISKARLPQRTGNIVNVAPDLCVEILSPATAVVDQTDKFDLYAKHGVPHYWIIDPKAQTLDAYSLNGPTYTLLKAACNADRIHLPPFPDLEIPLADLWPTRPA